MRTLKMLKNAAEEEACSAYEYAMCAIEYKSNDVELARFFHDLSETELDHSTKFLAHMEQRYSDIKKSGIEVDDEFEDKCSHAKRHILMKQAEAKRIIGMYR